MLALDQQYIAKNFSLPGVNTLVFLNGVYEPSLSNPTSELSFQDTTLKIPKNTRISAPLHLLFLTSENCQASLKIVAEENTYSTIIEEYASLGDQPYTNEIKTQITASVNSEIVHYKLQFENSSQADHQTSTEINQAQSSKINSNIISKGSKTAKDSLQINLEGEKAAYHLQEISLLKNHQEMNNQIRVIHLKPNCTSNILAKSIVDDQATNTFDCRIIVPSGATHTETHVTSKNLLLSESATVNTSPELEVYVDEVNCTHGATVGQLDQDALFYLRSRGMTKNLALKILTLAFVQEITDQFAHYDRFKQAAGLIYAQ